MHKEVKFKYDPECEWNIAHEVINELKIVDSCMTCQKRWSYAHKDQCHIFCFGAIDVYATYIDSVVLEFVPDVTENGLHQTKFRIDAQQHHSEEEDEQPKIGHWQKQ